MTYEDIPEGVYPAPTRSRCRWPWSGSPRGSRRNGAGEAGGFGVPSPLQAEGRQQILVQLHPDRVTGVHLGPVDPGEVAAPDPLQRGVETHVVPGEPGQPVRRAAGRSRGDPRSARTADRGRAGPRPDPRGRWPPADRFGSAGAASRWLPAAAGRCAAGTPRTPPRRRAEDAGPELRRQPALVLGLTRTGQRPAPGVGELHPGHPAHGLEVEQQLGDDGRVESEAHRHFSLVGHAQEPDGVQRQQLRARGDGVGHRRAFMPASVGTARPGATGRAQADPTTAVLVRIDPDGTPSVAAEDRPNGSVVTRTSWAGRLHPGRRKDDLVWPARR